MKVIRNEENEPNIAKMIMAMIDQVHDELPEEMHLDEICELAVLAWNISLTDLEENKIAWSIPLRQQVQKMVAYKRKKFIDIKKEIVDIELDEENGLYVECEDPDDTDHFDEDFENEMMEMPEYDGGVAVDAPDLAGQDIVLVDVPAHHGSIASPEKRHGMRTRQLSREKHQSRKFVHANTPKF